MIMSPKGYIVVSVCILAILGRLVNPLPLPVIHDAIGVTKTKITNFLGGIGIFSSRGNGNNNQEAQTSTSHSTNIPNLPQGGVKNSNIKGGGVFKPNQPSLNRPETTSRSSNITTKKDEVTTTATPITTLAKSRNDTSSTQKPSPTVFSTISVSTTKYFTTTPLADTDVFENVNEEFPNVSSTFPTTTTFKRFTVSSRNEQVSTTIKTDSPTTSFTAERKESSPSVYEERGSYSTEHEKNQELELSNNDDPINESSSHTKTSTESNSINISTTTESGDEISNLKMSAEGDMQDEEKMDDPKASPSPMSSTDGVAVTTNETETTDLQHVQNSKSSSLPIKENIEDANVTTSTFIMHQQSESSSKSNCSKYYQQIGGDYNGLILPILILSLFGFVLLVILVCCVCIGRFARVNYCGVNYENKVIAATGIVNTKKSGETSESELNILISGEKEKQVKAKESSQHFEKLTTITNVKNVSNSNAKDDHDFETKPKPRPPKILQETFQNTAVSSYNGRNDNDQGHIINKASYEKLLGGAVVEKAGELETMELAHSPSKNYNTYKKGESVFSSSSLPVKGAEMADKSRSDEKELQIKCQLHIIPPTLATNVVKDESTTTSPSLTRKAHLLTGCDKKTTSSFPSSSGLPVLAKQEKDKKDPQRTQTIITQQSQVKTIESESISSKSKSISKSFRPESSTFTGSQSTVKISSPVKSESSTVAVTVNNESFMAHGQGQSHQVKMESLKRGFLAGGSASGVNSAASTEIQGNQLTDSSRYKYHSFMDTYNRLEKRLQYERQQQVSTTTTTQMNHQVCKIKSVEDNGKNSGIDNSLVLYVNQSEGWFRLGDSDTGITKVQKIVKVEEGEMFEQGSK